MIANVQIDLTNLQGRQFLQYARTLPFARVIEENDAPKSTWDEAVAEGAMTVDEFVGEMKARIAKWPDNA